MESGPLGALGGGGVGVPRQRSTRLYEESSPKRLLFGGNVTSDFSNSWGCLGVALKFGGAYYPRGFTWLNVFRNSLRIPRFIELP